MGDGLELAVHSGDSRDEIVMGLDPRLTGTGACYHLWRELAGGLWRGARLPWFTVYLRHEVPEQKSRCFAE